MTFVFGAGIALVNHWQLIKKYVHPAGCIDNNPEKWGKLSEVGLPCVSLAEAMKDNEIDVLITVGDPYAIEAIKKQLDEKGVQYSVLVDKLAEWGEKESLPDHLRGMIGDKNRKLLLMNTPEHDNVGDHLIALAEMDFLKTRFPDFSIYEITDIEYTWFGSVLREYIDREDILLITGGGFLGSMWLYNGESNVRGILQEYSEHRIIILPQTIYFEENDRGKNEYRNSMDIYNRAGRMTLLLREKRSFRWMENDPHIGFKFELMPDMALFYRKYKPQEKSRKNSSRTVLFCIREDKESVLAPGVVERIKSVFAEKGYIIKSTTMHSRVFEGLCGRNTQVKDKLSEIAKADIVVTDTLHCMVASALTGTECIAFDNLSGKVSNIYHSWLEPLSYIRLQPDMDDIRRAAEKSGLEKGQFFLENYDEYLDRLERLIRDEK